MYHRCSIAGIIGEWAEMQKSTTLLALQSEDRLSAPMSTQLQPKDEQLHAQRKVAYEQERPFYPGKFWFSKGLSNSQRRLGTPWNPELNLRPDNFYLVVKCNGMFKQ